MQTSNLNAKTKFREGYIMTLRPFEFSGLKNPIQKLSIFWAYTERSLFKTQLTPENQEKAEELYHTPISSFTKQYVQEALDKLYNTSSNYEELHIGDIVQIEIDNQLVRLYPDEYQILSRESIQEAIEEDGYHTICDKRLFEIKDFTDKYFYLTSRGVTKSIALKWASLGYKDLVYYKPCYELLKMFCRDSEIFPDKFYEEVEGILIINQNNCG